MLIRVGYEAVFDLPAPTPMLLLLNVHPSRYGSLRGPESMRVEPHVSLTFYADAFGNTGARMLAPAGRLRLSSDAIVEDDGLPDPADPSAAQHPVEALPPDVLPFLLASRYCEVDLLMRAAWDLFGHVPPGWARAQAVCDWCHRHLEYGYRHARATKSAAEVFRERRGVCRDFAHLAITFCRALNIPARYASGYLGDVGLTDDPEAKDFHAWLEVYLGGRWWAMDARHNAPRVGRILMARGRDAVDAALTTAFGAAELVGFRVWTHEVP